MKIQLCLRPEYDGVQEKEKTNCKVTIFVSPKNSCFPPLSLYLSRHLVSSSSPAPVRTKKKMRALLSVHIIFHFFFVSEITAWNSLWIYSLPEEKLPPHAVFITISFLRRFAQLKLPSVLYLPSLESLTHSLIFAYISSHKILFA